MSETPAVPPYFEPGRYENIPNETYHAANGISSSQIKDARISLLLFHKKHVTKEIERVQTKAFSLGSLLHALALEPETVEKEFSIEPALACWGLDD